MFSSTPRRLSDTAVSLDVAGELHGDAALTLQAMIFDAIIDGLPDELVVDLGQATYLGVAGHLALVSGYILAIEHGTRYRVVKPPPQARRRMQATATLDMLADSDDLGALLIALLARQHPSVSTSVVHKGMINHTDEFGT